MEPFYPLHARICESCLLVQLEEFVTAEDIFSEYAYFSSYSDSWVAHARDYVDMAVERFGLDSDSLVIELASNDGYLLQHVVERGIPALGIEPAANVAEVAREQGIETVVRVLRPRARRPARRRGPPRRPARRQQRAGPRARPQRLRRRHGASCCARTASSTIEVPHLLRLIEGNQFDTIYHEHFSYFSFLTAQQGASPPTGSRSSTSTSSEPRRLAALLRAASRTGSHPVERPRRASSPRASGRSASTRSRATAAFAPQVMETKWALLEFLIASRREGKRDRRLRRAREGQHAPQLLRHPHRPARVHGRPQPVQAGPVPAGHAHPDPPPGGARAGPPGLHPDPAVEPEGRDRRPARLRARVGRAVRRPDPGGGGAVKVVLFCGGQGLRMREASEVAPKPMIPIGTRPVLWHVMKYYAHFGYTDFVLCLGYKAEVIKQFFLTYNEAMANDFVLSDGGANVHLLKTDIHNWNITFVRHRAARLDRRAAARRPRAPRRRRGVPRQLRRHAHRREPAGDDRARRPSATSRPASSPSARTTASTWCRWTTTGA